MKLCEIEGRIIKIGDLEREDHYGPWGIGFTNKYGIRFWGLLDIPDEWDNKKVRIVKDPKRYCIELME